MRTVTETKMLFTFNALTEEAKQKAIETYQLQAGKYFDSAEWVFEDAATIADLFGLDIRQRRNTSRDGLKSWYDPAIYYSGFWSQGDGACFEGRYRYKKGALKAVKNYAPIDIKLHRIVKALQDAQKKNFYRIVCDIKRFGHYYHSGCMTVDCENSEDSYRKVIDKDDFIQAMRDFADWIYNRLEEAYEYDTSEENAKDYLENSDYEFTENGENGEMI